MVAVSGWRLADRSFEDRRAGGLEGLRIEWRTELRTALRAEWRAESMTEDRGQTGCHLPPGAATRHPKRGDDWIDDGGRRQ